MHETLGPIGPNLQLPVVAAAAGLASQRVSYKSGSPMPWRSSPLPPSPQPHSTSPSDAVPVHDCLENLLRAGVPC